MRPPTLPLVALVALSLQVQAGVIGRSADLVTRAHRQAARRSHGLARDLRTSFNGIFARDEPPPAVKNAKVYCVSTSAGLSDPPVAPNNTHNGANVPGANGTSISFSPTGKPTGTASANATGISSSSTASPTGSGQGPPLFNSPFTLQKSYQGKNFFNGWDFFDAPDPTHGIVDYLSQSDAQSAGLISINNAGHAIMSVETTPQVQNLRKSVRITTEFTYTGGLVIMDATHMPTGCGTWPAFWSNGPNWPAGGEIDIVEGVNDYTVNQATIHTNPGCTMPSTNSFALNISGAVVSSPDCSALQNGNAGCGVRDARVSSYGPGFNENGGGVFAMQWDNDGISVFFFPRDSIPEDISAKAPVPDTWGQPMAFWPTSTCNSFQFFNSHSLIFDTTLCGDWASGVWGSSGITGQEQSCAQRTGFSTCEAFVQQRGDAFDQAYWEVGYVQVYQPSS